MSADTAATTPATAGQEVPPSSACIPRFYTNAKESSTSASTIVNEAAAEAESGSNNNIESHLSLPDGNSFLDGETERTAFLAQRGLLSKCTAGEVLAVELRKLALQKQLRDEVVHADTLWTLFLRHRVDAERGVDDVDYDDLRITYDGFKKLAYDAIQQQITNSTNSDTPLDDDTLYDRFVQHEFLNPRTFAAFVRDEAQTVPVVPLFTFAAKRILLYELRLKLEMCSSYVDSRVSQEDVERFLSSIMPHLRVVRDISPSMIPYFLCHASRKFTFFCDRQRTGCMSIDSVMESPPFTELLRIYEADMRDAAVDYPVGSAVELTADSSTADREYDEPAAVEGEVRQLRGDGKYVVAVRGTEGTVVVERDNLKWSSVSPDVPHPQVEDQADNWFSLTIVSKVYTHYCALDVDADGMLSREELLRYNDGSITPLAVRRVFDVHCHGERLDYKRYLDFVLATENTQSLPGLKYIWRLLDLHHTSTYVTEGVLRCFCREVASCLAESGLCNNIRTDDILNEIIDLLAPKNRHTVTLEDFKNSNQASLVLSLLIDYRAFYQYDRREQLLAAAAGAQQDGGVEGGDSPAAVQQGQSQQSN